MMLMDAKDFLFNVIKFEFNNKIFPIEITLGECIIYKTLLNNDIIYSTECVDFYFKLMKYGKNCQHNYHKFFKFSVSKYKHENKTNIIPSIYEFRSYMKNVKHNDRIDESNNDERVCKSTAIIQYMNMNMKVVYYFKVYAELLYTISRYRT